MGNRHFPFLWAFYGELQRGFTMIVAIARELGSRGTRIAAATAAALNIPFVHREIAEHAARRWNVERNSLALANTARDLPFGRMFGMGSDSFLTFTAPIVLQFAARSEGAVLLDWGAAFLLRSVPHAVCARVVAPLDKRARRIAHRLDLPLTAALSLVKVDDARRAALCQRHFDRDWRSPENYDLSLNTARLSVEEAVEQLVSCVRSPAHQATPDSLAVLGRLRLAAESSAACFADPVLRELGCSLEFNEDRLTVRALVADSRRSDDVLGRLRDALPAESVDIDLRTPARFHVRTSSI